MIVEHDQAGDVSVRRMVICADWDHWVPQIIIGDLLPLLQRNQSFKVIAICVPRVTSHWKRLLDYWWSRVLGRLKRLLFNDARFLHRPLPPANPDALARRYGFEILVAADLAHIIPDLDRLRADVLFSIFWKKKFNAEFLNIFGQAINYHNGTVPNYRGLRATQWSLYRNESRSGFTIHRIDEGLDCGNVLATADVLIDHEASIFDIELRKTRLAAEYLPVVLDALASDLSGTPQTELHKYNSVREIDQLRHIEDPVSVSSNELLRRIRAFGPVRVRHSHCHIWLSGLATRCSESSPRSRHVIRLSDGYWRMKPSDILIENLKTMRSMFTRS